MPVCDACFGGVGDNARGCKRTSQQACRRCQSHGIKCKVSFGEDPGKRQWTDGRRFEHKHSHELVELVSVDGSRRWTSEGEGDFLCLRDPRHCDANCKHYWRRVVNTANPSPEQGNLEEALEHPMEEDPEHPMEGEEQEQQGQQGQQGQEQEQQGQQGQEQEEEQQQEQQQQEVELPMDEDVGQQSHEGSGQPTGEGLAQSLNMNVPTGNGLGELSGMDAQQWEMNWWRWTYRAYQDLPVHVYRTLDGAHAPRRGETPPHTWEELWTIHPSPAQPSLYEHVKYAPICHWHIKNFASTEEQLKNVSSLKGGIVDHESEGFIYSNPTDYNHSFTPSDGSSSHDIPPLWLYPDWPFPDAAQTQAASCRQYLLWHHCTDRSESVCNLQSWMEHCRTEMSRGTSADAMNAAHKFAALLAAHVRLGEFGSVFVRRCYHFDARLCVFDIPPGEYQTILLLHLFDSQGPLLPPENTRNAKCIRGSTAPLTPPAKVDHDENILGVPANDEWGRVRRPRRPLGLRLDVRIPEWSSDPTISAQGKQSELEKAASHGTWEEPGQGYPVRFEQHYELSWNPFQGNVGKGWQVFISADKMHITQEYPSRIFRLHNPKSGHENFAGMRFGGMLLRKLSSRSPF
ncbi:hypothetical protein IE81DRAFT_342917 [Ceraceosorus guamensis]|uniref:Uncharacterized protein n=1 Tax=Ceraceosorus guamensis TaxID=1522189 RepID=A0A316VSC2_9BASI|nr:hypothetical protein IE81DRAFT_342917 [Ceraceosorus guamensis]PWN40114.1 hypothetical protein IE81DRAFT_342917 [Ceraceosorus guamensis]